jgi:RNA polymerase sigma-70 factor (ECF subfamily)
MTASEQERVAEEILACTGKIHSLCLSKVSRLPDPLGIAEDLTQATVLKAWKNIGNFRHDCALSSWLYRIASNVSLDYLRRHKRRIPTISLEDVVPENEDGKVKSNFEGFVVNHTEERYVEKLTMKELERQISPELFEIFELLAEGWTYKELAKYYNLRENTVKTRVFRFRKAHRHLTS